MCRQAVSTLEDAASEMEAYYDSKSDTWQESETGEWICEMREVIEDAVATIRELL